MYCYLYSIEHFTTMTFYQHDVITFHYHVMLPIQHFTIMTFYKHDMITFHCSTWYKYYRMGRIRKIENSRTQCILTGRHTVCLSDSNPMVDNENHVQRWLKPRSWKKMHMPRQLPSMYDYHTEEAACVDCWRMNSHWALQADWRVTSRQSLKRGLQLGR